MMQQFVDVGGYPTLLLQVGKSKEEENIVVLVIPGNPGICDYYQCFMEALHVASGCNLPVWCISHVGHVPTPENTAPSHERSSYLSRQILHKVQFIQGYIPDNTRLILVGHSIGCYMILHMMEHLQADKIIKCLFLFPTIERMAASPKGKIVTPILRYFRWASPLFMYPLYYLMPSFLLKRLLEWRFHTCPTTAVAVAGTLKLLQPSVVSSVFNMAHEEMQTVKTADYELLDKYISKVMFYYGSDDHWCPIQYHQEMLDKYPVADIVLCDHGFAHAFVLGNSKGMADVLWNWMKRNITVFQAKLN